LKGAALPTTKVYRSDSPIEVVEIEVPNKTIEDFQEDAQGIYDELLSILVMKQIDYGPLNIWNAPGGATNGLMVRMSDKLERLKNLIYNSIEPNNEALEDSFIDIANYAIIAMMVERGIWEKYATQQK
jgi:hypothetical protein